MCKVVNFLNCRSINIEYTALWVIPGVINSEMASVLATGLGSNTFIGCAPISVGLI